MFVYFLCVSGDEKQSTIHHETSYGKYIDISPTKYLFIFYFFHQRMYTKRCNSIIVKDQHSSTHFKLYFQNI